MNEDLMSVLSKLILSRLFWHYQKVDEIKKEIKSEEYGPKDVVSDWVECWLTTADDVSKAIALAQGRVATIVFCVSPSFDTAQVRPLPVLLLPHTKLEFTEVVATTTPPVDSSPLRKKDFDAKFDHKHNEYVVTLKHPGGPLPVGTYQTMLFAQESDCDPTPVAMVYVDVRQRKEAAEARSS